MISNSSKPSIIFVALDENINNNQSDAYQNLSAVEKIGHVKMRIKHICEELRRTAPEAMWILAWKEYGINDGPNRSAISHDAKAYFKVAMSALAKQYPNLTIVAGTVQTYKQVNDRRKLDQIDSYYHSLKFIDDAELKFNRNEPEYHYFRKERARILPLRKKFPKTGINVIRNSCFVFSRDKIWCHDKSAPVGETSLSSHVRHAIFQPAKKKNLSTLCRLSHPITHQPVTLGIEICNEHGLGVLQHEDIVQETYLQLILSDSIKLYPRFFNSEFILQMDPLRKPRLIVPHKENATNLPIQYYQTNMYAMYDRLRGPLEPLYPFAYRVVYILDRALKQIPQSNRKVALTKMRDDFEKFALTDFQERSLPVYNYLSDLLLINKNYFKNEYIAPQVLKGPDLEKIYNELFDMNMASRKENPLYNDYQSVAEAPLQSMSRP